MLGVETAVNGAYSITLLMVFILHTLQKVTSKFATCAFTLKVCIHTRYVFYTLGTTLTDLAILCKDGVNMSTMLICLNCTFVFSQLRLCMHT